MQEQAYNGKRTIGYGNKDIKYIIEAYQYDRDEEAALCLCDVEFEGEVYFREFDDFCSAVRKYLELKDKGWEIIDLRIVPVNTSEIAEFFINISDCKTLITIYVNESNINSKLIEKISKIDKIIHE